MIDTFIIWMDQWNWAKIGYLLPLSILWITLFMFLNNSLYGESMSIAIVIIAWKMKGKYFER